MGGHHDLVGHFDPQFHQRLHPSQAVPVVDEQNGVRPPSGLPQPQQGLSAAFLLGAAHFNRFLDLDDPLLPERQIAFPQDLPESLLGPPLHPACSPVGEQRDPAPAPSGQKLHPLAHHLGVIDVYAKASRSQVHIDDGQRIGHGFEPADRQQSVDPPPPDVPLQMREILGRIHQVDHILVPPGPHLAQDALRQQHAPLVSAVRIQRRQHAAHAPPGGLEGHENAAARVFFHIPLVYQTLHGETHRRAAHAAQFRQLALRRKTGSCFQLSLFNGPDDDPVNLLVTGERFAPVHLAEFGLEIHIPCLGSDSVNGLRRVPKPARPPGPVRRTGRGIHP